MSNLSRREKIMLYALAVVIIVAGGTKFVLLPLMDRYQDARDELFVQQLHEQEMAGAMGNYEALQEEMLQEEKRIAGQRAQLYPYMTPDQADHMLTSMLMQHALEPLNLSLGDPALIPAVPYGAALSEEEGEEETDAGLYAATPSHQIFNAIMDAVSQGRSGEAVTDADAGAYASLPGYRVQITATGATLDNLISFTDAAAAKPALSIESFTTQWDQSAGAYKIDMVVLVYMNDYAE